MNNLSLIARGLTPLQVVQSDQMGLLEVDM